MRLTLWHKIVLITCLPLVLEFGFVLLLGKVVDEAERESALQSRVRQTLAVTDTLDQYRDDLREAISDFNVSPENVKFVQRASDFVDTRLMKSARVLSSLAQSEEDKKIAAKTVLAASEIKRALARLSIDNDDSLRAASSDSQFHLKLALDEFTAACRDARKNAESTPNRERETRQQVRNWITFGIIGNGIAALIVAAFIGLSMRGRLFVLIDNARRLSEGKSLNPPITGTDEIATLDHVFHEMTQALADAAKKERAIIEHAVDVICAIGSEGHFLRVSPASSTVWGYAPEELIGQYAIEIEDIRGDSPMMNELKLLMEKKGTGEFENTIKRKDGTLVNMLWSAHWSQTDEALFCVAKDITERKRAEQKLRESEARTRFIIENMPVGLVVLNQAGEIETANPSMEEIWGYSTEELEGMHVSNLLVTEPIEDMKAFTSEFFERTIGHIYEKESKRKNGKTFPAHISLTEFEMPQGKRLLGILMDVTERHEIERFKREFIGVVSHELRTPLTSIRGSLKLMLTGALGTLSEQANKAATIAERSAGRLIGLVNDILDMEKLEAGKLDMVLETTQVAPVLERSLESVRSFADQHNVIVEIEPTECRMYADGDRIVQVLVNLMSNAIKYSPKEGTVSISTVERDNQVEIRVTDRGRGIPESHIGQVFEKFKQVDKTDATQKGGTGLGLTICKLIIEQHNGTIGVESEFGKGSTFWFRVPKEKAAAEAVAAPAPASLRSS